MRWRLLIAAILALLLVPIVFVAVLLYTETGVRLAVGQLWRLERLGVHIEGVSGTFSGPLKVQRFQLEHPRVQVEVHDIIIEPQLRGLLLQTLQAGSVTARDAKVVLRDAEMPPPTRPPRFLPSFLRVDVRKIELTRIRYVHLNGTVVEAKRAGGRVTITSRELLAREASVEATQFDASGDMTLRAGRPFELQAHATGHLRMDGQPELTLEANADGTFDRLAIAAHLLQPERVSVDALMTRPDERWNIEGRVVSAAFALSPWLDKPPFSLRNVALDARANPDGISVSGSLAIPELDRNDLTIDGEGRFADRVLTISGADIALTGTPAQLHTRGTIAFDGEAPTLDLAARWNNVQWPLHGEAIASSTKGEGTLHGPLPYDFTVTTNIVGPNIPAANGSARGVLARDRITVAEYSVNAFDGSLTGAAALQFAAPRAWSVSTRAVNVNPSALHREFGGRVALSASAHGRGLDKNASFTLSVADLRGTLRSAPVEGRATVHRDRRGWEVRGANVALGSARLELDGTLRDTIDARWSLRATALEQLLPQAAGSVQFTGTASGRLKTPHVVVDLRGENLSYEGWQARELTIDGDVDAGGTNQSRLSVMARQLGRGGPLLDALQIKGEGNALDHRIDVDATGLSSDSRQSAPRGSMRITGRYERETWTAKIATTELSTGVADLQLKTPEPASVMVSRQQAELDNFCLVVGAGRMCAEGDWKRGGAWQGTVSGYEIPLASILPPSSDEVEIAGRIEGRVHAFGSPTQPWQGEAGMRIVDAAIIYKPPGAQPERLNLGTGGLAATAKPQGIDFSFGIQAFTDTFVYANAKLVRNGTNELMQLPLTGELRARAADANILPLVFPEVDRAAGLLTANATVAGTLALPEVNGRIELANGEFDTYRVNLALRELALTADLKNTDLDFRAKGRAGEGRVEVDGKFTWRAGQSNGNLWLRGQDLLVADLAEYRVIASPDLRFRVEGKRMDVAGDVRIPHARVQPAQLTGAVRASDDARYVGEHEAERAGRFVVHSEIRIEMGDDVRVDTFGLQGRIVGAVGTTLHTGETAIGRGELSVADGRYEAYGQKLEISRGRLLFDTSPLDDPGLDIEARRKIEAITVGLNVRGTLQEPRLTFFSDPSMPQTQIASYLLTGKAVDSMVGADAASVSGARDALALQGGGFLASQLGRRLGLEEVGVESSINSAGEANTALVLGKFLSPRLFISYGISLTEQFNTLKLRYTVSDKWVFRTEAGENQSADLEYTIER
jgi:translocation and assembly module TamB